MELELLAVFLLLCIIAFLSACEAAILTINRMRLRYLMQKTKFSPQAKSLSRIKANTMRTIMTVLIANNVANISASFIVAHMTSQYFGDAFLGISAGILTIILIVFAEIIPKNYGTNHADSFALSCAQPIEVLSTALLPFAIILEKINMAVPGVYPIPGKKIGFTEDELRSVFEVGVEDRAITHDEKRLFERVLDFNDTYLKEIMTPKRNVKFLKLAEKREDLISQISSSKVKSHYPVIDAEGKVAGVLQIKKLLSAPPLAAVRELLDKPFFVSREMVASELFKKMQKSDMRLAIVLDPEGKLEGIVTMEDLLEEIVGEMGEDGAAPAGVQHEEDAGHPAIIVSGDARVHDIEKELGMQLPESEKYGAVSAYLHYHLRKMPSRGDVLLLGKCRMEIKEVDKDYRVHKVAVSKI